LDGLDKLNIKSTSLVPGAADLSFLIPRDLFGNNLDSFAKELRFISRLIRNLSEGVTSKGEEPQLESLSSSIPTVTLDASAAVIGVLAKIVNLFLEAWEKIGKIRKIRTELKEMGLKVEAVDELGEQVTTIVEEIVEESTELVLKSYHGHDPGRRNELEKAISTDVRRLFGQIERGLTVEVRAEPTPDTDEESAKPIRTIIDLGKEMKFPPAAKEPLLLAGPEILEGELHKKMYKKTTTKTTTSTKKEKKTEPHDRKE
jgi:hypothetical protein